MEIDDYENDRDRERMQEDDPNACEVTEGIFSSNKCEPKKKEAVKTDEKKKSSCGCKTSSSKRGSKREKLQRAVNPFIVFYLKYYYDKPSKRVTEAARAAGKLWCRMSDKEKEMYIKIANEERARRQKMKEKRKKKC